MKPRFSGQLRHALIAGLFFPALNGCTGVVGQWTLKEVTPTAAQRDVQYRTLTLQKDGSFYAEATEGRRAVAVTPDGDVARAENAAGPIRTVSGTYNYDKKAKTLALHEHDHEQNTYDAQVRRGGRELQLLSFWEGRKLKAVYERVDR